MFDVGVVELLLIMFLILVIFGPKQLLEISYTVGKFISSFRSWWFNINSEIKKEIDNTSFTKEVEDINNNLKNIK